MSVDIVSQPVSLTLQNDYHTAEQELQDRVLQIYGANETDVDLFRPALADNQKIGFFSLDRSSQTEVSEILCIKELIEVIEVLLHDVANIRRDINLNKHVMQADYEVKLQKKSMELYRRINERVTELEKLHKERVSTLRHAFRQQLSDAISRLSLMFEKELAIQLAAERKKYHGATSKTDEKYRELQATIKRQEDFIQLLQIQIDQYRLRIEEGMPADRSVGTKTREEEDDDCDPEEFRRLREKLELTEESLNTKEEEAGQLKEQVDILQMQLKRCRALVEQLHHDKYEIKNVEVTEARTARQALEKMKAEMQKIMDEKIKHASEEAYNKGLHDAKAKMKKDSRVSRSPSSPDSRTGRHKSVKKSQDAINQMTTADNLDSSRSVPSVGVVDPDGPMVSEGTMAATVTMVTEGTMGPAGTMVTEGTMGPAVTMVTEGTMGPAGTAASVGTASPAGTMASVGTASPAGTMASVGTTGPAGTMASVGSQRAGSPMTGIKKKAHDVVMSVPSRFPADVERIQDLTEQNGRLVEMLERERAKNVAKVEVKVKEEVPMFTVSKKEQELQTEITRLRKETEKINRTWEKKFAILQRSLFALKDESYLRHTLQKQSATLHHAAVSYGPDKPIEIKPVKQSTIAKKPLPEIPKSVTVVKSAKGGRGGVPGGSGDKDFISYTVSVPSGRGSAVFSVDENQVLSDAEQEMPVDVAPLPSPTLRTEPTEEASIPSSNTRVIVVPSAEVS